MVLNNSSLLVLFLTFSSPRFACIVWNDESLLAGPTGCGKSALLSNWAEQHEAQHPHDLVFLHFSGCDSESTELRNLLLRLTLTLSDASDYARVLACDTEKLACQLDDKLKAAAEEAQKQNRRIYIVLDALNQLQNEELPWLGDAPVHALGWLPKYCHRNVHVVVSTLPGACHDALQAMSLEYNMYNVPALTSDHVDAIVDHVMRYNSKTLLSSQKKKITSAKMAANPLFLRLLLDELVSFGVFEELDKKIDELTEAENTHALLDVILDRIEQTFDGGDVLHMVGACILVSRQGMRQAELHAICRQKLPHLSSLDWFSAFEAFKKLLIEKSGM